MFELDTTTRRSHLRSQTRPHLRRAFIKIVAKVIVVFGHE